MSARDWDHPPWGCPTAGVLDAQTASPTGTKKKEEKNGLHVSHLEGGQKKKSARSGGKIRGSRHYKANKGTGWGELSSATNKGEKFYKRVKRHLGRSKLTALH